MDALPPDALVALAEKLDESADLDAWSRTCKYLRDVLHPARCHRSQTDGGGASKVFIMCGLCDNTKDLNKLFCYMPNGECTLPTQKRDYMLKRMFCMPYVCQSCAGILFQWSHSAYRRGTRKFVDPRRQEALLCVFMSRCTEAMSPEIVRRIFEKAFVIQKRKTMHSSSRRKLTQAIRHFVHTIKSVLTHSAPSRPPARSAAR